MFKTHPETMHILASRFEKTAVSRFWFVDITEDVKKAVKAAEIEEGLIVVSVLHTTAGFFVNENEPGLLKKDLPEMLARLCPDTEDFEHDSKERRKQLPSSEPINGVSHLRTILGSRESFFGIIHESKLLLGKWQAIILMDFDLESRTGRTIQFQAIGSS